MRADAAGGEPEPDAASRRGAGSGKGSRGDASGGDGTSRRRAALGAATVLVGGALLYLSAWPVPAEPVAWSPPSAPPLSGPYAQNRRLAPVERMEAGPGPEDVAFGPDGRLHTGVEDGRLLCWRPGEEAPRVLASTGGRPMGLAFDGAGRLLVADARRGLLRVDLTGSVRPLAVEPEVPKGWANGVDVAPDGTIYFTSPSGTLPARRRRASLLAGRPDGRLLGHDPRTGATWTVLDSLRHPNGVAVDPGGEFVLVAETGGYRVIRRWLRGPLAGRTEALVSNLPGFPDGVSIGPGGDVWIALVARRSRVLDAVRPHAFLVGALMRAASVSRPPSRSYGLVVRVDRHGDVMESLHDPGGRRYGWISNAVRHGPYLYLGSVREGSVARLRLGPDRSRAGDSGTVARFPPETSVFREGVICSPSGGR